MADPVSLKDHLRVAESSVTYSPSAPPTWEEFDERLVVVLGRLAVDQFFILSAPGADEESIYYVQFAQGGRTGLRVEAVSNAYLSGASQLSPTQEDAMAELGWQFPDPRSTRDLNFSREWPMPAPFEDVATLVVRTFREVYGVASPGALTYRRFGRTGHDIAEPGLGISPERPTRPRGRGQSQVPTVEDVTPRLEAAIRRFTGVESIVRDEAGNIPIAVGAVQLHVRLLPLAPPLIRVFAPVLHGQAATHDLLAAINERNTEIVLCRVLWFNGDVIVASELPAADVVADDLARACLVVAGVAEEIGPQLAELTGAVEKPDQPTLLN